MRNAWSASRMSPTKSRSRALLDAAFDKYCQEVPWANDYQLSPKSVLRDMLESASDFKGYIQKLGIARSEGILLRYLAEATVLSIAPFPLRSAMSACVTSFRGSALWCARSTRAWWTSGRTPATPLHSTPHRRRASTRSLRPSRLHAVGAQRALPPRDPCRPRARSRLGRAR